MTRPAQLRYEDSNGDTQIIGVLNTDSTQSDIDGLQLKNSGSGEYTRIELTGDSNLLDAMPVNKNDFNDPDEPEIFLDVYSTSSDSFVTRDRVFAEKKGTIETDDGDYRNEQLYGFQKWVGRQKVDNLGPINSDVAGIISTALSNVPGNYTVQTNGTIPSVQNYTYTGRIDSLIRDVIRDYPNVKIWWSADTSSGDFVVRVEELGAGSTVETITFPDPDYKLISYEPEDTTNIVNRVIVKGTDSNNNTVEVDTDNFTSGSLATDISNSKDKYGETTIERNIGYLQDTSHAEEIAKNLLELEAKPHLEVALPFQEGNVLNASVDITDDRYGIDGVYKVVKQRDFFKDSRTEVELSFEKNASEDRRAQDRDVGEERASLFPESQTDVGNQSVTTGDAEDNTGKTGGVGDSNDRNNDESNVNRIGDIKTAGGSTTVEEPGNILQTFDQGLSVGSWTKIAGGDAINPDSSDTQGMDVWIWGDQEFAGSQTANNYMRIRITNNDTLENFPTDNGVEAPIFQKGIADDEAGFGPVKIHIPENTDTAEYDIELRTSDADESWDLKWNWVTYDEHTHPDDIDTDNNTMGLTDDVDTVNNPHGGGTGSDQHGGDTEDNVNVNIASEDKTQR